MEIFVDHSISRAKNDGTYCIDIVYMRNHEEDTTEQLGQVSLNNHDLPSRQPSCTVSLGTNHPCRSVRRKRNSKAQVTICQVSCNAVSQLVPMGAVELVKLHAPGTAVVSTCADHDNSSIRRDILHEQQISSV